MIYDAKRSPESLEVTTLPQRMLRKALVLSAKKTWLYLLKGSRGDWVRFGPLELAAIWYFHRISNETQKMDDRQFGANFHEHV